MGAKVITVKHPKREVRFYCPVTGTLVFSFDDNTFDECTSHALLAFIASTGECYFRREGVPEVHIHALDRMMDELTLLTPNVQPPSIFEMHTFVPNVLAGLFPNSTQIFEVQAAGADASGLHDYVFMDFEMMAPPLVPSSMCDDYRLIGDG